MCEEEWRTIPGLEGIAEASSLGRIRSVERTVWRHDGTSRKIPSKVLVLHNAKQGDEKNSCLTVNIVGADGKSRMHVASSLVLAAFACPRPQDMIVVHRNGNRADLRPSNLFRATKESVSKKNHPDPSEQEIKRAAEQIQASWSERDRKSREVCPPERWTVPQVALSSLPRRMADAIESVNKNDQTDRKSEAAG